MDHLPANLSAMAAALGSTPIVPADDGRVRCDTSGTTPVLYLATPAGGSVALNSRRNPLGEALGVLDAALAGCPAPGVVAAIGLGLGFIIDAIERRCPEARILALEPEPGCVRPLLERRDLTALISSGRLLLLWGPEYRGAAEGWRTLTGTGDRRVTVVHPALSRRNPEAFAAAARIVERMAFGARANAEARRKFAGRYLLNTLRNLPVIAESGDVGSLFGAFDGVPGVIVSAGPSLDANIADLPEVGDRAVLIAVDTSLRPLLSAGIQPHLVVAVDPSEVNGRHLRGLPATGHTHLVAEGSLDPAVFEAFGDRIFTFKVSDHEPWPWLRAHGLERATLRAWGSVATSAFDLAVNLGCTPIVFVGQDLAYTGGRPYCRGTTFEADWSVAVGHGATLPEIWRDWHSIRTASPALDVHGRPTRTTPSLTAFRDWLVEQCSRQTNRRFINATGAGILLGPHVEQAPLPNAIPYGDARPDPLAVLRRAHAAARAADARIVAAAAALRGAIESDPPPEPVATWRQFAADTVSPEDIRGALETRSAHAPTGASDGVVILTPGRLAWIAGAKGIRPRRRLPSTSRTPERVAAIRAISTGADMPSWTLSPSRPQVPGEARFLHAVLQEATSAVGRLLARPDLVTGLLPGQSSPAVPPPDSLSLTAPFDWAPAARPDVDLIERCVTAVSGLMGAGPVDPELDAFRWTVVPSVPPRAPQGDGVLVPISRDTLGWWARRALVVEWAGLLKALRPDEAEASGGFAPQLAGWISALADGPAPVALDQSSAVLAGRVQDEGGHHASFRFDLSTPLWRLMRALTGAVVRTTDRPGRNAKRTGPDECAPIIDTNPTSGDGPAERFWCAVDARPAAAGGGPPDPRVRFLERRDAWLRPVVLALPGSYTVGTLDDTVAFVTPYMERCSRTVDATGLQASLPEWPNPIVGEQRGPATGGVAWSNAGPWYLMRRRTEDGPVETVEAPFRPARAAVGDDGTSYWTATTGGLWRWDPDGGLACVAPTPPLIGLSLDRHGIRLDPVGTDLSGQQHRRFLATGWIWRRDTGRLENRDLGPLGPAWGHAASRGRWAAAHPAADIVRLGDADGSRFDLACDWPVDVAWAGDALLAVTARGAVLLFDDVGRLFS